MSQLLERFLRYVKVHTTSDPNSPTKPSTPCQWDLLHLLHTELEELQIPSTCYDAGYLIAQIPETAGYEEVPRIALLAHVDTSPEAPGEKVSHCLHPNYDGKPIQLKGSILTPSDYPDLLRYVGHTLITSDGTTLLGADDKAGVAILMTLAAELQSKPELAHGPIALAFTTDEEVGRGLETFDESQLQATYAYTIDGGLEGEFEYECFHAASARITATGHNVHPGSAYHTMRHALQSLIKLDYRLGYTHERPEVTQGREGFLHLCHMSGDVSFATAEYIIRDHDRQLLEQRIARIREVAQQINEEPHTAQLAVEVSYQYRNMYDYIAPHPEVIEHAIAAYEAVGVKPIIQPIRGGTDGAVLSERGIPCPNIFTSGGNFHSLHEYCSLDAMERCLAILTQLVRRYAASQALD
ncbi:peptidase T [Porphyromonas asaccharolytica]